MIRRRPIVLIAAAALLLAVIGIGGAALLGGRVDARASYERALVHYREGRYSSARVELLNVIDAEPRFVSAHLLQARILNAQGEGASAVAAVERARAAGAPAAATRAILAEALLLSGDPERALAEASQADIPADARGEAARIRALAHAWMGDRESAVRAFDEGAALDPDNGELWLDLARFRLDGNNVAGAIEASVRAVEADPRNVEALSLRGYLVRRQYGLAAALPWYDRALAIDPNHVQTLLARAAVLGDMGQASEMLTATRRVLELSPGNIRAYYLLAVLAARAGDYDLARTLVGRMGNGWNGVPGLIQLRGILDFEAGNYQSAISHFTLLVGSQPANLQVQRLLGAAYFHAGDMESTLGTLLPYARRADADTYVLTLIGRAFERLGRPGEAAAFLDRAAFAASGPAAPLAPPRMTDAQLAYFRSEAENGNEAAEVALIRAYLALGRNEDALRLAGGLARNNPNAPGGHTLLGDVLATSGRFEEAARSYARAANIDFNESTALRLVEALRRSGSPEEARRALTVFLSQNPGSIAAARLAADLHLQAGEWEEAIVILENLRARIGNRDAALMGNLGWAYLGAGDLEHAAVFARRAYLLMPMNAAAAGRYGWILWQSGERRVLALALLEKARDLAPADGSVQWHLAQAYAEIDRPNLARRAAEAALADARFTERQAAAELIAGL